MTIAGFKELIEQMAYDRMGLVEFSDYLSQKGRDNKYLREEYLPLLAVVRHKKIVDTEQIELGQEREPWDARIGGHDLYEVTQALPEKEHEQRLKIATGSQSPAMMWAHIADDLQFPGVIVDAIEKKHAKEYQDARSLVVVFGGEYSGEEDAVIHRWMSVIRRQTTRGSFKEILLVELARRKVFTLFPSVETPAGS